MKSANKMFVARYVVTNFVLTSLILLIMLYVGGSIEGVKFYVKFILRAPSFFTLVLLRGFNDTLHFTAENTFRIVSFIFYSLVIALIQLAIYKRRKNEGQKTR